MDGLRHALRHKRSQTLRRLGSVGNGAGLQRPRCRPDFVRWDTDRFTQAADTAEEEQAGSRPADGA